jgi:hypothetical protein
MMKTIEQPSAGPQPIWRSGDMRIKASTAATEIILDALDECDMLLIQTANSVYSFSLTDVKERCGLLMGGRLGEASAAALLVGAQDPEGGDTGICHTRLIAGLPAVFVVATERESTRLVTSPIKSLTHLKPLLDKSRVSHSDRQPA